MSLREKTAWITLATIVVCFGSYYAALLTGLVPKGSWQSFHLGVICIIALVVLQVVLNLVASMLSAAADKTPRDEREQMIVARSHTIGYYVLMFGVAAVLLTTHIPIAHSAGEMAVNTVYFGTLAMVIAALTVAIAQIIMFRRGA